MLSPRPLVSSALALLGLAATLGFARSAHATPSMTITTKTTIGADLLLDELTVEAGGILEVVPLRSKGGTGTLRIRARKITVKKDGTITATKAGYLGVNGADGDAAPGSKGGGKRGANAGNPGGGGGYLGAGADGASATCVTLAESAGGVAFAMPTATTLLLGSAGGAANVTNPANAGGDGGGVILLEAAEIVIDGTVEARGGSPMQVSGVAPGGGSGGLIVITTAHLSGSTGVISVAGGNGPQAPGAGPIQANNGGGGAGGFIIIKARDVSPEIVSNLDVKGGTTGSCPPPGGAEGEAKISTVDATFCVDVDGDMHLSNACGGDDCDDSDAAIKPDVAEVCNGADDNCNGVNNEGDNLCSAGRTCDATAKMCIDISDAGTDAGPVVDAGPPPDHIAFEGGCSLGGDGGGLGALATAALGAAALAVRRHRARREARDAR
ncbi:MAG: putative metal-binding motif-containing protein, partial [Byssovorax sp.]